jgi:hypothetical protein
MATLKLTEQQVLTLKAAWAFFNEQADHVESLSEALELDEDEEEVVLERINEVNDLIMNL